MLDIKLIRKNSDAILEKIQRKEPTLDLSDVLMLDEKVRTLKLEVEDLQNKRNSDSKKVGELKKRGESAETLMAEVRSMGETISALHHELAKVEAKFVDALSRIPNLPMDDVLISQDKEKNVVIKEFGEKKSHSFTPKNHLELNEKLKLFDFEHTAKTPCFFWPQTKYQPVCIQI